MSSLLFLVLFSLLANVPVTQSRPRETSHSGLYDDLKPVVPFVDKQDAGGLTYGEYFDHLGNLDNTNIQHDKYINKENGRVGDGGVDGGGDAIDKTTDKTDNDKDVSILPIEGGTEDMTSRTVGVAPDTLVKSKKQRHRHRDNVVGRRHGKKALKDIDREVEDKNKRDRNDDRKFLGSEDLDDSGFSLDKFYQEHPDFKKNVATITDNVVDTATKSVDTNVDEDDDTDEDDDLSEDDDDDGKDQDDQETDDDDEEDDEDNSDDDDDDDDDDDADKIDTTDEDEDTESEDNETGTNGNKGTDSILSKKMSKYYNDYYDEDEDYDDDSSYSSSEQDTEALTGKKMSTRFDWFKQYDKMYGDQPAKENDEKATEKSQFASVKVKYVDNGVKYGTTIKDSFADNDTGKTQKTVDEKEDNVPKTDVEPSTSPNPPTSKENVKSTVTQPAYPQWKSRTETWNYIESKPIEACRDVSECPAGRICKFGLCLCGQPDFCEGHSKAVCGSDGQLYPSHCELHRTACVLGVHIMIDYEMACLKDESLEESESTEDFNTNKIISEPVDSESETYTTSETDTAEIKDIHINTVINEEKDKNSAADIRDEVETNREGNNVDEKIEAVKKDDQIKTADLTKDVVLGSVAAEVGKDEVENNFNLNNKVDNSDDVSDSESNSKEEKVKLSDYNSAEYSEGETVDTDNEKDDTKMKDKLEDSDSEDNVRISQAGSVSAQAVNDTDSEGYKQSLVPLFCTPDLYMQFKADVLQYHCIYFGEPDCDRQTQDGKQKLAELMFNYYDKDLSGRVELEELWEMQLREAIDKISSLCSLLDIVTFDELGERDEKLSADEFIQAFDIPDVLEHRLEVVPLLATVGNGLEIKCDVTDSPDVVWKRNGIDLKLLDFPGISALGDGSLYLETVGVHHVGNLTCHDRQKPSIQQIHMLSVQKPPHVLVTPRSHYVTHGSNVVIRCHAEGYPKPNVEWQFEERVLEQGVKYHIQSYDNSLTISNVDHERDSGDYKCIARNTAGISEASVKVTVHRPNSTDHFEFSQTEQSFIIFHDDGYTMHEPSECLTQRHVKPEFGNFYFIPDELDAPPALCETGMPCVWGGAINVKDTFVYATQPRENRIIVIDIKETFNPNQIIFTDHMPVSLYYMEHLDEVWVLCWNGENDNGSKTIIIIRNASQKTQHHAVHTQPIGNRFDLVQDIFLPPNSELHHPYKFGYTVHNGQQGLFKVDLDQKKYMKAVDFTKYDCVPKSLAFVPLGGHVMVQCIQKLAGQRETNVILQLDYVTDIVTTNITVPGVPYVSPDSNSVVIVNEKTGEIAVYQVTKNGQVIKEFDVTVGSPVAGVTFHKAGHNQGYDLYMTSIDQPIVFSVGLLNGKVDEIRDIGGPDSEMFLPWFKKTRQLVSGDIFSEYLATMAVSSLVILDGKHHNIQCDYKDLQNPAVIAYAHLNNK